MAEDKKKEIDVTVIEVTEEYLKEKLYKIRGKRVLFDADLAEIYGYDTKGFNRQVKNNIEKFDEDFMFELTDEELEDLRYKNCTANISSKSRYNPHVFTEQGLYMLMTVLKGPLAVKQSKALIRTFKKMKDYILENRDLIGQREILQLSMETANNRIEINKINSDMISLEKQISDVAEGLKDVVTKSELADMMNSFERPSVWRSMDDAGKIGTTLGSFVIVGVSVFAMIFELLRSYEEQRKQLLSLSEDLNFAANHDPLTRLYNRRYLVNQVNEWICKPEKSFWIVLMDVDDFKAVNDTYGHGYGDDVLREAGRLMLEEMMGKGIAARFGGEEFMLVFEQDDREQVLHSFRNIQEGLRRYSQNTRQTDITISGGMERYEADKQMDLLFTSVDRKLYIAKNNGKNRIVE